jgi:YVTN family beta-propeller protein
MTPGDSCRSACRAPASALAGNRRAPRRNNPGAARRFAETHRCSPMTERPTARPAAIALLIVYLSLAAAAGCDAPRGASAFDKRPGDAVPQTNAHTSAAATDSVDRPRAGPTAQYYEHQGVRVALEILPVSPAADRPAGELREGDDVRFRFTLTDRSSGVGLGNTHPAAWLARRVDGEPRDALGAAKAIARYVRGDRLFRPALDLNVFYVLTMNDDGSVTVVDPVFGFGNSRLLALTPLKGNAEDWVLSEDQNRLYVSVPSAQRIAVVDTTNWSEVASISPIRDAGRLSLQPDGHYLWAAYGEHGGESGVALIATDGPRLIRAIPTGRGYHEIAFDRDGMSAFVTNHDDSNVSVIDVRDERKVADISSGRGPAAIAYSAASRMLYVAHDADGTIAVLNAETMEVIGRIQAEPGLGRIRFAPGGRLGFALNTKANVVHIVDAALGRIIQTADTAEEPDDVTFAGRLAYVHHRATATVRVIPIDALGVEGNPVSVVDFPGGQNAPSAPGARPSRGVKIVPASGEGAVLVANPADKTIYYYKEGMAAPMGSFSNYNRMPRAVLTVDRSLRERRPGVYETVARLGAAGEYNIAFLLDNPRMTHYFDADVKPDPARLRNAHSSIAVEAVSDSTALQAGKSARLRFRIVDRTTGAPKGQLKDVTVLAFSPPSWQNRYQAAASDEGTYAITVTPPRAGTYYFYAESPTASARFNRHWFLTLDVTAKEDR